MKSYFKKTQKRKCKCVVRYAPLENLEHPLAYILYKGEHWFLLDQIVRIMHPFIKNDSQTKQKKNCCLWETKQKLLAKNTFGKIGGSGTVKITSCFDPYVINQVKHIIEDQIIKEFHDHNEHDEKQYGHEENDTQIHMDYTWMCNSKTNIKKIQQINNKTSKVIMVLLIDFQSIFELCRMTKSKYHTVLSLIFAFSSLCTGRQEARSALTKLDKEKIAAKQKWRCGVCKKLFDEFCKYEIDHAIALSHGGRNSESNLWALCVACHKKKTYDEKSYPLKPL